MIENVSDEVSLEQVQSLFSPFGTIVSCRLYRQGIVQLSYASRSSAERALNVCPAIVDCCLGDERIFAKGKEAAYFV